MDNNGGLTVEGLAMEGRGLGNRQDWIIGGKCHGGAIVTWRLRNPWRSFGFVAKF
jgi:hypothetical protein